MIELVTDDVMMILQVGDGLEASYFELKKTGDFFDYKKGSPANMYGGAVLSVGIPKGRLKCQFKVKTICGGKAKLPWRPVITFQTHRARPACFIRHSRP